MNEFQQAIIAQVQGYLVVVSLTIFLMFVLLRGFLGKYLKVRTSFGRLLLIKIRTPMRDYFSVGQIDEGFLVYKHKGTNDKKKYEIRIALPKDCLYAYRCLGVTWIDIEEETNAICTVDYSTVSGFDAKKFSDLNTRALTRPSVSDNKEKIIIAILIFIVILLIANAFLGYQNYKVLEKLPAMISGIISTIKGTVTPAVI